jgi:hypothetical protein
MALLTAFPNSFTYDFDTTATGVDVGNLGGGTTSTGFIIFVHINSSSMTDAAERTAFFGAHNVNGKRVQFYDKDGTTVLYYDVIYYDNSGQKAIYAVGVPQIDGDGTDYINCGHGSDPNSSDQDDNRAGNMYDSGFFGVYYSMGNGISGSTLLEWSQNGGGNGTITGAVETAGGDWEKFLRYDGTNDRTIIPDAAGWSLANDADGNTLEDVTYIPSNFNYTATAFGIICKGGGSGSNNKYEWALRTKGVTTSIERSLLLNNGPGGSNGEAICTTSIEDIWNVHTGRSNNVNSTSIGRLYAATNGVNEHDVAPTATSYTPSTSRVAIGGSDRPAYQQLDNAVFRFHTTKRSDDYVLLAAESMRDGASAGYLGSAFCTLSVTTTGGLPTRGTTRALWRGFRR